MRRSFVLVLVLAAAAFAPGPAHAADPGRWVQTAQTTLPIQYYQGVTVDPARNFYFDGIDFGLYRTDWAFTETARNDDVIPPEVHLSERYNHIGDLTWDAQENGRLLLPLECYYPGTGDNGNPCAAGSIGVADPSLKWRYYVKLDPAAGIKKAMWAEVAPDGQLFWTSGGPNLRDLLAYRVSDIKQANAPPHAGILPVRRLVGAVPPSGVTGATFIDGRLFVAGSIDDTFQVWSIDLTTGARRQEIERTVVGESEGLATAAVKGGILHWLIQPYNDHGPPTYGVSNATLLTFRSTTGAGAGVAGSTGGTGTDGAGSDTTSSGSASPGTTTGGGPGSGSSGTPAGSAPSDGAPEPAKLQLARATVYRSPSALDVLAPITARASGRAAFELQAAGQRHRWSAAIDSVHARIRIRASIPSAQARMGTGILTITYPGDPDTRPQVVRLRAANVPARLEVTRPTIEGGRLRAHGTISTAAHGVVRVQLEYYSGGRTTTLERNATVANGRWSLDVALTAAQQQAIAARRGTVHSYILFTGYLPARMRGEMRSYEVLAAP